MRRNITINLGLRKHTQAFRLAVLAVVVFAVAVALLGSSPAAPLSRQNGASGLSGKNRAVVIIHFGNGTERRSFAGEIMDGMTIADAVSVAGVTGSFSVRMDEAGKLRTLNGRSGLWLVLRNNQRIDAPLTKTPLVPGDTVVIQPEA